MQSADTSRQQQITLLQERSAGTFARVYLAEARGHDGLSRIVAVKVLKEQWSESAELLARTQDEARLLARLHHKNILRVEALAEIHGQPAIVMEFVDGLDLKQLVEKLAEERSRVPPRAIYKIGQNTASALEAAWGKVPYGKTEPLRVVHRDVKPSNIMVSTDGEVKVLDFGTARFAHESRVARTGVLRFGSMKYMSPERRTGDRGEHASDVYALGLVLIEMLRAEILPLLPLDRAEHDDAVAELITGIRELGLPNAAWDDSLRQTLARTCAFDPAARLTAAQVVELLRAFSEQASGTSLDSFAATTVARLAQQVHGQETEGALSGSRVFIAMATSGNGPDAPLRPAVRMPPPDLQPASTMDGFPPDPGASTVQELEAARRPAQRPAAPVQAGPPPGPPPEPRAAPVEPPDEEGTPAEPGGSGGFFVKVAAAFIAAFAVVLVVGALFAALGGAALWYFGMRRPSPDDLPERVAGGDPASPPPAGLSVAIRASDDTVQWIRVETPSGERLVSGTPAGSGTVPAGVYEVSAKVVARPTVRGELRVERDLDILCSPQKDNRVKCADEAAGASVTLAP